MRPLPVPTPSVEESQRPRCCDLHVIVLHIFREKAMATALSLVQLRDKTSFQLNFISIKAMMQMLQLVCLRTQAVSQSSNLA